MVLSSGHRLTALRFEGLVQTEGEMGWSLRQLAVMRRADGGKVIPRIDGVRVFEEVPGQRTESWSEMPNRIEHFLYGAPARLKRLRAALPDGIAVDTVAGGLVLRETLGDASDLDAAIVRVAALARAHGMEYDGHGQGLGEPVEDSDEGQWLDIQRLRWKFGHRLTALRFEGLVQTEGEMGWSLRQLAVMRRADGGKVIPRIDSVRVFEEVPGQRTESWSEMPNRIEHSSDGRFGHAIHLGSNRQGYLLLDISTLVTDRPSSPDAVRDAPRRYRQRGCCAPSFSKLWCRYWIALSRSSCCWHSPLAPATA